MLPKLSNCRIVAVTRSKLACGNTGDYASRQSPAKSDAAKASKVRRIAAIASITVCLLSLIPVSVANGHGGGLDSDGGHNCNVGSCAGTYHCHQARGPRCGGGVRSQPQPSPASFARCVTLGVTMTTQEVRLLQLKLAAEGFDPGPLDGVFGRRTSLAVNVYELANRLKLSPARQVYYGTLIHMGISC
jgi:hypothetical protein